MAGRIDYPAQPGFHPRLTKIYCEGAQQRIDDGGELLPTVNPYNDVTQAEENVAWQAGWDSRDGAGLAQVDMCAVPLVGGPIGP